MYISFIYKIYQSCKNISYLIGFAYLIILGYVYSGVYSNTQTDLQVKKVTNDRLRNHESMYVYVPGTGAC